MSLFHGAIMPPCTEGLRCMKAYIWCKARRRYFDFGGRGRDIKVSSTKFVKPPRLQILKGVCTVYLGTEIL